MLFIAQSLPLLLSLKEGSPLKPRAISSESPFVNSQQLKFLRGGGKSIALEKESG